MVVDVLYTIVSYAYIHIHIHILTGIIAKEKLTSDRNKACLCMYIYLCKACAHWYFDVGNEL